MGLISITNPADTESIDAADVSTPFNTIKNVINGNLDNDNIASDAAIAWSKMASTAWTDFSSSINPTGFSSLSTEECFYIQYGKVVFVQLEIQGTSNATTFTFTLPVAPQRSQEFGGAIVNDNGSTLDPQGRLDLTAASTTATCKTAPTASSSGWTGSSTKGFRLSFFYEAD